MSPLVSCLCVSKPSRWWGLQRSILDFTRQSYANKELIIVVHEPEYAEEINSFLSLLSADSVKPLPAIKVFQRSGRTQQDGLMPALAQARGDLITPWDDDNLNHPDRLSWQVGCQGRFQDALTAMNESLYYFYETKELFAVAYWHRLDVPSAERCAVTTLMAPRDLLPPIEPQYQPHVWSNLVNNLARLGRKLVFLGSRAWWHLVGVAGNNLRTYDVHRRLGAVAEGTTLSSWLTAHKDQVTSSLDAYIWDDEQIDVCGADGVSFQYTPGNQQLCKQVSVDLVPVRIVAEDGVDDKILLPVGIAGAASPSEG